jgi:hypothetical protein
VSKEVYTDAHADQRGKECVASEEVEDLLACRVSGLVRKEVLEIAHTIGQRKRRLPVMTAHSKSREQKNSHIYNPTRQCIRLLNDSASCMSTMTRSRKM